MHASATNLCASLFGGVEEVARIDGVERIKGPNHRTISDHSVTQFRREIESASQNYGINHPNYRASLLRGTEASSIKIFTTGHMIYLAAGADIYRPLYNYPLIENYHLVDILMGWGKSPQDMLSEIMRRLSELDVTSVVTIEERGFLDVLTAEELEEPYNGDQTKRLSKKDLLRPGANKPLVLSVRWMSAALGAQHKKFFVHAVDFFNAPNMHELVTTIRLSGPLVGILETGYGSLPTLDIFDMMMSHLTTDGFFVFEEHQSLGFNQAQFIHDSLSVLGSSYRIKLSLPDTESQIQMASTDRRGKNNFKFDVLISGH